VQIVVSAKVINSGIQLFLFLHNGCTERMDATKSWARTKFRLDGRTQWEHLARSSKKMDLISELVAYVDGGSLGNPGPSGIGVVISGCASGPVRIAKWIGRQDNNVAEYAALMEALQYAVARKARTLHVYSDSQVVVRQMTGEYVCRSARLYSLHWTCRKLARSLKFSISHVPREDNAEANRLAQSALRNRPSPFVET
jgi:ribonuclease HI